MRRRIVTVTAMIILFALALSACDSNDGLYVNQASSGNNDPYVNQTNDGSNDLYEYQASGDVLSQADESQVTYMLPEPKTDGGMSVEAALYSRRSQRNFQDKAISAEQLSQILWAAYGISSPRGLRTAPSAGALYPLEIYAVVGNVDGIAPGVYRYVADGHKIVRVVDGDVRSELSAAALGQRMVADAPATIFFSAVFERTTARYGERGVKYVYIEVGHSAQNVYLQAEALGLGTCAIGAFIDDNVRQILRLPADEEPLYLMPIGYFN